MYKRIGRFNYKNHNEIACMIVEPIVQGAAGIKIYSARFLKASRDLTKI